MASSTSSSLRLLSLTPQTLSISFSKPTISNSLSFPFSPFKQLPKLLSFSSCTPLLCTPSAAPFVRYVAVSSEFDQLSEVEEDDGDLLGGDSDEPPSYSPDLKLFVGNLPFSVDSAALAQLFEQAGNVEMVEVIYDKMTGRSRGFGFVTMSTMEEVEAAAQQFNGYELEGRALRVNSGPPPPRKEDSSFRGGRGGGGTSFDGAHRVYVGNLPWGVDNLALENLFSEQGKVMEARVVYDRDSGRSRGFGFVTYSSADEVNNAIERLDGADLDGRPLRVSVAEARPRRQF